MQAFFFCLYSSEWRFYAGLSRVTLTDDILR